MLLFGAVLTGREIRLDQRKTSVSEVTERGIMIYTNRQVMDVSFSWLKDLTLPWERWSRGACWA
jgi:hypothetical protein